MTNSLQITMRRVANGFVLSAGLPFPTPTEVSPEQVFTTFDTARMAARAMLEAELARMDPNG